MKELIMMNWVNIVVVLVIIIIAYIGLQTRFKGHIAGFILEIVRNAEEEYGSGTGLMKKALACEYIYDLLPAVAKIIISQKTIGKMIDEAAEELTEYLKGIENTSRLI